MITNNSLYGTIDIYTYLKLYVKQLLGHSMFIGVMHAVRSNWVYSTKCCHKIWIQIASFKRESFFLFNDWQLLSMNILCLFCLYSIWAQYITNNYRKFLLCRIFFSLDICRSYWIVFSTYDNITHDKLHWASMDPTMTWFIGYFHIDLVEKKKKHLRRSGELARLQLQIDKHSMIST